MKKLWIQFKAALFILTHLKLYRGIVMCKLGHHPWADLSQATCDIHGFTRIQRCAVCRITRVWWDDKTKWKIHDLPKGFTETKEEHW